jgi:hypothetical protein
MRNNCPKKNNCYLFIKNECPFCRDQYQCCGLYLNEKVRQEGNHQSEFDFLKGGKNERTLLDDSD